MSGELLRSFGELRVEPPLGPSEIDLLEALRCDIPPGPSQLANVVEPPPGPCAWRATDDGSGLRFEGDSVGLRVAAEWLRYLIAALRRSGCAASTPPTGFTFDHVVSGHVDVVDKDGRWVRLMPTDGGVTELIGTVVFSEVRVVPRSDGSPAERRGVAA